jgi:hypothetical protein
MSAVFVWYTAGYFLWAIYYRHRESVFGRFIERQNWLGYFTKDLCHALALYWILLNVRASPCVPLSAQLASFSIGPLITGAVLSFLCLCILVFGLKSAQQARITPSSSSAQRLLFVYQISLDVRASLFFSTYAIWPLSIGSYSM